MLTLLVGMIASGKDSFTTMLAERGYIIINDDDIIKAVHGGNYLLYDKALKPIYKGVEIALLCTALEMGRNVVINRPNYKETTRKRYIDIAKTFDCPVTAVVFPKEDHHIHAQRRFKHDARGLDLDHWLKVARRHTQEWVEPTLQEGMDNIVPAHVAKQMVLAGGW